jgi:hypothetical protein
MLGLVGSAFFVILISLIVFYFKKDTYPRPPGPRAFGLGFILPLILGKVGKIHETFVEWFFSLTLKKLLTLSLPISLSLSLSHTHTL